MNKRYLLIISIGIFLGASLKSCKKIDAVEADKPLFDEVNASQNYVFYKGNSLVQKSSSESPHNQYFRVRFNQIAAKFLTDNGKIPQNQSFPDGSVVVKELYDTQAGSLKLLSVMKKSASSADAGKGWLWAEFNPDGTINYSQGNKGGSCTNCHGTNDRDYVRLFNIFP